MFSLHTVDTQSTKRKSPLDILHQTYNTEIVNNLFAQLPRVFPTGISEKKIEDFVISYLKKYNCQPASKHYNNFPSDISISRNHVLAHGVPSDDLIEEGDVLTIDIVSKYFQWYSDISWTYAVGDGKEAEHLLRAAWAVSCAGVQAVRLGNTLRDVANAVQIEARSQRVHVYTQFIGHGIGTDIHEPPHVLYDNRAKQIPITNGMVLCIEPIVSMRRQNTMRLTDGSYIGIKKYKSAVYEHMVAVCGGNSKVMSYNMIDIDLLPKLHPFY